MAVPQTSGEDLLPSINVGLAGDGRSNPSMPAGGPAGLSALHGLSGISKQSIETAEEVCSRPHVQAAPPKPPPVRWLPASAAPSAVQHGIHVVVRGVSPSAGRASCRLYF